MKRLLTGIQTHTGTTKSEALVLLTLSIIVLVGTVGKRLFPHNSSSEILAAEKIIHVLDSLQMHSRTLSSKPPVANATNSESASPESSPFQNVYPSPKREQFRGTVNLNTATEAQLLRVKGVGPATAKRIVELRTKRRFNSVEDLLDVKGIGAKKLEAMRPYVSAP